MFSVEFSADLVQIQEFLIPRKVPLIGYDNLNKIEHFCDWKRQCVKWSFVSYKNPISVKWSFVSYKKKWSCVPIVFYKNSLKRN